MIYLDTSVVVPIFVPEAASEAISAWLEIPGKTLVSADWILTEFASALGIKVRRGEMTQKHAGSVWDSFEIFSSSGLRLVPVTRSAFVSGAALIRSAAGVLRAGDALHLAMALEVGATTIATADEQLGHSASAQGLTVTRF